MNKKIILLLVVVVIGVAIGGYFLFFAQKQSGTSLSSSPSEKLKDILGIQQTTKDWQTYKSKEYGFSIKYPEGYSYNETQGGGEGGVMFQPKGEGQGWILSVLVVPSREKSYEEIVEETRKNSGFQGKPVTVLGVKGIEFRAKQEENSDATVVAILLPFQSKRWTVGFTTLAPTAVLEKEALPRLEAFLSTFKPE